MPAVVVLLLFPQLDLARLSPADAARFQGLPVPAGVTVVNPPDTLDGITYAGDDTLLDGFARTVYLTGGGDIGRGDRVTVFGRSRVFVHPPTVIEGSAFPTFREVRVDAWVRWPR